MTVASENTDAVNSSLISKKATGEYKLCCTHRFYVFV